MVSAHGFTISAASLRMGARASRPCRAKGHLLRLYNIFSLILSSGNCCGFFLFGRRHSATVCRCRVKVSGREGLCAATCTLPHDCLAKSSCYNGILPPPPPKDVSSTLSSGKRFLACQISRNLGASHNLELLLWSYGEDPAMNPTDG